MPVAQERHNKDLLHFTLLCENLFGGGKCEADRTRRRRTTILAMVMTRLDSVLGEKYA